MTRRILISTGGSGGHVLPATILYEHFKDKFHISAVLATPSLRELANLIRVRIDFVPVILISGSLDGYRPPILCESP